jgi:choice-of-anchor A domain-containing protein
MTAPATASVLLPPSAERGLDAMRELNVITFGSLASGHSIEGRTFVGGAVSGGNYGNGSVTTPSQGFTASDRATLTVVGSASNVTLNNGANGQTGQKVDQGAVARAQIGGAASGIVVNAAPQQPGSVKIQVGGDLNAQNFNPSATRRAEYAGSLSGAQAQDLPFLTKVSSLSTLAAALTDQRDQLRADLLALSTRLGGLQSNATATYANNALTFDATGVGGSVAVFEIAASALNANGSIVFNLPVSGGSAMTTIINVTGGSVFHRINANSDLSYATPSVIWNFVDATTATFQTSLFGSVLAPKAAVTNNGRLNGSIVAASLQQNAQIHLGTYAGRNIVAIPEPASWALMIAGFGLAGAALRRRSATIIIA